MTATSEVRLSKVRGEIRRFFVRCDLCGAKGVATLTGRYTNVADMFAMEDLELKVELHEVKRKKEREGRESRKGAY